MNELPIISKNILGFETDFDHAATVVFGAPFDGTVTYRPGSRFAPQSIRQESIGIETYSPYQDMDLSELSICDLGDLDLPFGNTAQALRQIKDATAHILENGKKPLMIGGEHLVTAPAVEAVLEKYPDLQIIHFDAHADLRTDYLGEALSHSTVMRLIWNHTGDERIWQFGIRSGLREEFEFAHNGHTNFYPFDLESVPKAVKKIQGPVYLTIDLDVLDPSVFPGTGTPEAGGVTFNEFLKALLSLRSVNLVGADIVELSPHYDASGCSTALACKVLRELAIILTAEKQ